MTPADTANTPQSTASSMTDTLKESGMHALAGVRDRASDAAARATEAARTEAMGRAETAKSSLAQEGERLAQTLRRAVDSGDDSPQARVLSVVADSVDDLTASLRNRSLNDLLSDAETFARRNPGLFVAVAALAGFAVARFARASTPAPVYNPGQPAVSQGYATMPPPSDVTSYGSTGSGYGSSGSSVGSGQGPSYGSSAMAGSTVSTHGMTTGGGSMGADDGLGGDDLMGGSGVGGLGTGGVGSGSAGLGTLTDDDLADEDTAGRTSPSSMGTPT